ncbi:Type I restriction-modification system methylation subunit [Roseomonas mucosa]|uniref:type I restriction-modification system subunit M n=1 Tax=Roseomonas mucosa TaxID=207340 RepID=UPI0021FAFA43|nr:class I SAM-dependent DNA methyltransferase [Roseomonas mucosa]QDJ10330.1 Type I restriction-modification system methylation subunit [Roseomonas mucosa]
MVREVLRERFIETLTELGGSAGNGRLREMIGWQDDTYWSVHAALIEDGTIIAGRGRGGSVALAARPKQATPPPAKTASEPDLLAPIVAPTAAPKPAAKRAAGNGAALGFEAQLFQAADKLRKNLEPSDYKHVALGLIFLKHISLAFEAKRAALLAEDPTAAEDPDEYLAENVFWVPKEARWSHLQASARQTAIGKIIDDAMAAIEEHNPGLKGVLPKDYNRPALDKVMLGELIDLISGIATGEPGGAAKDLLGRVYEYFLGGFAGSEGKRGGEFYTPRSVVRVLVEMLEPYKGRVYDPCCGSGGMFVQSEKFVAEHGGRIGDIAIYGQESNYTTWRLAKMNLAVRGIDADIRWNNEGSFHKDELKDLRFDHILANPPFNISDWGGERLREDARWVFGAPPAANANYGWLQHIWWHLAPGGAAGVVLANGALTSNQSGEGEIRKALLEADALDCIISLPAQLFYSTQIPASLWFLARDKAPPGWRKRSGSMLMIDARKMGGLVDRTRRELADDEIERITSTYHAWQGRPGAKPYTDVLGFCRSCSISEVREHHYALVPGRYVGFEPVPLDQPALEGIRAEFTEAIDAVLAFASDLETSAARLRDALNG